MRVENRAAAARIDAGSCVPAAADERVPSLRVCLVVESHWMALMGGAEYQAHLLAEELASRRGTSVLYLAKRLPATPCTGLRYELERMTDGTRLNREVLLDTAALWRKLHELRPDVIYQRMKQAYTGVCALYARRAGIPFIFHSASDPDVGTRWLREFRPKKLATDVPAALLGTWGISNATHVVVQTDRQAALLEQRYRRAPAATIPNFQPLPPQLPSRAPGIVRVLWVGNLKPVKQPELFVHLARCFAHRDDLEFIMVGKPSPRRRFVRVAQEAMALPNVRYLGALPLESVNELMAQADIFVNTSAYEGSPNTFIQAWARGAVVTSLSVDVDGGLERAGIGFCAGNFERLVQVVDRLARSPAERHVIAERAFAHVHAQHSLANARALADFIIDAALETRRSQLRAL